MIKEGKYMLGTIAEIAHELAERLCTNGYADQDKFDFKETAFATPDWPDICNKEKDLETVRANCEGWYGINKIETGFDSPDLHLFADYYGGGSGYYNSIYEGMDCKDVQNIIANLMKDTLSAEWTTTSDTIFFAECMECPTEDYKSIRHKLCDMEKKAENTFPEWYSDLKFPNLTWGEQVKLYAEMMDRFCGDTVIRITKGCPYMVDEYEDLQTGKIETI